jgi:hypothetical protein
MSVSGISSDPNLYQIYSSQTNPQQQQDPLQSGDLTAAQQAYNALTQNASNPGQTQNGQLTQDLNAVGQALKSGDVSAAKQAYSKLQQDFQNVRHAHHRHHKHPAGDSQSSTPGSSGNSSVTNGSGSESSSVDTANSINLLT